ncbi:hypothetical protein RIVM261_013030 [Rivularia sp. IAM M-261]|nr:hypothetical protein RIVM261_013030 [Rivularia sp. IAM M-261]
MFTLADNVVIDQETFLLNALAMGIACQILEQETVYSKDEWQVFLRNHAQEQFYTMSKQERETFIQHLMHPNVEFVSGN